MRIHFHFHEHNVLAFGEEPSTEGWPEPDELDDIYLDEENDVGYDSAEDDHIWIYPKDFAQPFDEEKKDQILCRLQCGTRRKAGDKTLTRLLFSLLERRAKRKVERRARHSSVARASVRRSSQRVDHDTGVMSADNTKDSSTFR